MNERERLIKLLENGFFEALSRIKGQNKDKKACVFLADYLLGNGVKLFPCEIGDTVYYHKTLCDGKYTVVIEEDTVKCFYLYVMILKLSAAFTIIPSFWK